MNLRNLLKLEQIKLSSKISKTYLIIHSVISFVFIFLSFTIRFTFTKGAESPDMPSFSEDPFLNYIGFINNFSFVPLFILALLIAHSVSQEFYLGIYKKHFLDGMEITDMVISKIVLIFILSIGSCILSLVFSVIIGLIFKNMFLDQFFSLKFLFALSVFSIKAVFILTNAYFLTLIARSVSMAIVIIVSYMVMEKLISTAFTYYSFENISQFLPYQNLNIFTSTFSTTSFTIVMITINLFILLSFLTFSKKRI